MSESTLVQTRIDRKIHDQSAAVLAGMGFTVSDAVRILLTRTANEGTVPLELITNSEAHDSRFRAKVLQALNDKSPDIPAREVEGHFANRRSAAKRKPA